MSNEHTRKAEQQADSERGRQEERIEDLEVGEDAATDVTGGGSISYGQIQQTYTPQKQD